MTLGSVARAACAGVPPVPPGTSRGRRIVRRVAASPWWRALAGSTRAAAVGGGPHAALRTTPPSCGPCGPGAATATPMLGGVVNLAPAAALRTLQHLATGAALPVATCSLPGTPTAGCAGSRTPASRRLAREPRCGGVQNGPGRALDPSETARGSAWRLGGPLFHRALDMVGCGVHGGLPRLGVNLDFSEIFLFSILFSGFEEFVLAGMGCFG